LHVYDWISGLRQPIRVRIPEELPEVAERRVNVSRSLLNPHLSPDGEAVALEARGEIIVVRLDGGEPVNLTNTPGVMERHPAWSADGTFIAYFSDESGEYALHVQRGDGKGQVTRIALPSGYYYRAVWAPDGRKIAFADYNLVLWYVDLAHGRPVMVDKDIYPLGDRLVVDWSPDSQ
jgi:tricorn protease